jgi:tetratricopeptide (TPR) repeat protein
LRLAEGLLDQQLPDKATIHFDHLLKVQAENLAVRVGVARCLAALGKVDEAREWVEKVLEKDPKCVAALKELGRLELANQEPTKAEKWLRKALELAPADAEANYQMVLYLNLLGKPKEAEKFQERFHQLDEEVARLDGLFKKIAKSPDDPALYQEVGSILLQLGKDSDGVRSLQIALTIDPKHRATHAALADYYEKKGDKDRAAEHRKQSK